MSRQAKIITILLIVVPILVILICGLPWPHGEKYNVTAVYLGSRYVKEKRYGTRHHGGTLDRLTIHCYFGDIQTDENDPFYDGEPLQYVEDVVSRSWQIIGNKDNPWGLTIHGKKVKIGDICCLEVRNGKRVNGETCREIVDISIPTDTPQYDPEKIKRWEKQLQSQEGNRQMQNQMEQIPQKVFQNALQSLKKDSNSTKDTESK